MADEVVSLTGLAHGGEAVGRLGDGRAVFVGHAIPGEVVSIEVTESKRRWARARLVDVLEASTDRVDPPCPYFAPDRCGGCVLQHVAPDRRRALQHRVVVDQLERLARVSEPPVDEPIPAGEYGYRSRARFGVDAEGRLAFRRAGSRDLLAIDRCLLLDEATSALHQQAAQGWGGVADVEVRTGVRGAVVVAYPSGLADQVVAPDLDVPVVIAGRGRGPRNPEAAMTEEVGGLTYLVSPTSFFQSNRVGAEALVGLVRAAAAIADGDDVLDLYSGVGLFAQALAADGAAVTAVEGSAASARDAALNLQGIAEPVRAPVERAVESLVRAGRKVDVTVLDPPRTGAGAEVVQAIAAITVRTIVYVSCDPAALARDTATLAEAGWSLVSATPVDQFAQTASIEVVATYTR